MAEQLTQSSTLFALCGGFFLRNRAISSLLLLMISSLCPLSSNAQNTLLWQIEGNDLQEPSYLYGTLHAQDERVFNFGDAVMGAFNNCEAFAMELEMDSSVTEDVMSAMVGQEGYDLQELIADSTYQRLDSMLSQQYGMGLFFFGRLKPMYLYLLLSQKGLKQDRAVFLDQYFQQKAREKGMEVIGIETVSEQLNALDYMSLTQQAALLEKAVWQEGNPGMNPDHLVDVYATGDLDSLHTLVKQGMDDTTFYKALITDRNERMSSRIANYVEQQPTFVAVGAGHLAGSTGIIELLRKKGYKVEPVMSDQKIAAKHTPDKASGWHRFKRQQEGFSVLFPGKPERQTSTVPTEQGNLDVAKYIYDDQSTNKKFFVTYNQYPYDFYHEQMAKKMEQSLPKELNAELLASSIVEINGRDGHRIVMQDEEGKYIIVTYFLKGRNLYQLMVSGYGDSYRDIRSPRFFTSFELEDD
jgi:uncharacterized protein YbaP (TraB family)